MRPLQASCHWKESAHSLLDGPAGLKHLLVGTWIGSKSTPWLDENAASGRSWMQEYLGLPSHELASTLLAASVVFHPSSEIADCTSLPRDGLHTPFAKGTYLVPFLACSADLVRRGKERYLGTLATVRRYAPRAADWVGTVLYEVTSCLAFCSSPICKGPFAVQGDMCADDQLSETTNWRPCVALLSRCHLCKAAPERMQHSCWQEKGQKAMNRSEPARQNKIVLPLSLSDVPPNGKDHFDFFSFHFRRPCFALAKN